MATAYQVGNYSRYTPVREKQYDINFVIAITPTTLVINDTYTFCFIPAFSMMTQLGFIVPDWDSNITPLVTWSCGDSGSATRYVNASITAQTGAGALQALALPYRYTADDNLVITISASAATAALTTMYIYVAYTIIADAVI